MHNPRQSNCGCASCRIRQGRPLTYRQARQHAEASERGAKPVSASSIADREQEERDSEERDDAGLP